MEFEDLKPRWTLSEWESVKTDNPISKRMSQIKRQVQQALDGDRHLVIAYGAAGAGKTFYAQQAEKNRKAGVPAPIWARPRNDIELLNYYKEAKPGQTMIFDEGSNILKSRALMDFIKLAADPKSPGYIEKPKIGRINLRRPHVILCNPNVRDQKIWPREIWDDLLAIVSRADLIGIPDGKAEMWEYTCYLAVCCGLLRNTNKGAVSVAIQNMALRWFTENVHLMDEVSPRRLTKIAEEIARNGLYCRDDWELDLQHFLAHPYKGLAAPRAPVITPWFVQQAGGPRPERKLREMARKLDAMLDAEKNPNVSERLVAATKRDRLDLEAQCAGVVL